MPRRGFHIIERFDKTTSHETGPKTIDDGAGEPAVLAGNDQLGKLLLALGFAGVWVNIAELRINEAASGVFAGGFIALEEFEVSLAKNIGERVGIGERPIVDEAVVAG